MQAINIHLRKTKIFFILFLGVNSIPKNECTTNETNLSYPLIVKDLIYISKWLIPEGNKPYELYLLLFSSLLFKS